MLADDLENTFSRVFGGKPSLFTDEVLWMYEQVQYRLRYNLKYERGLGSFVFETYLDTTAPGQMKMLARTGWHPDHTAQQVTQWVAKLILMRDAEL